MAERRCVYTVLMGSYETLLDQHILARVGAPDVDLICFTDDASAVSDSWEIRPIAPALPADPVRSSRRPKIMAHQYLMEYDASLYIDNTVLLTVDACTLFDRFLPPGTSMAVPWHSFRDTVDDEFDQVVLQRKDAAWVCAEQRAHYQLLDPGALAVQPLWNGMLFRRHHDPLVIATMTTWWEQVLRYSRRDQLSLHYSARRNGLEIGAFELDNHVSPIHEWPRSTQRQPGGTVPLRSGPERQLSELQAALDQEQRRSAELLVTADEATTELLAAGKRLLDLESAHAESTARVGELLGSTSWRVTAPLRALSRLAGRVRPR